MRKKMRTFAGDYIFIYIINVTAPEYRQLNAFARIDGAMLSVLMIAGFACYVVGLTSPLYGFLSLLTLIVMPFFVGTRLKHFRDNGLEGSISFLRGWFYVSKMFLYGGLLFALAVYAYLAYMDQGYLVMTIGRVMSAPEIVEALNQKGLTDWANESLHVLQSLRPIDFALNMLATVMLSGFILGLPIAAIMRKGTTKIVN